MKLPLSRYTGFALCAYLSHSLASADVLDVRGPNPDAPDLPTAVAMANDGDVIRVYPGSDPSFTIDGKSLTIVPSQAGEVIPLAGNVIIQNLGVGQGVVLHGLQSGGTSRFSAFDCQGSIRVFDGSFPGSTNYIVRCKDVVAVSSFFEGFSGGGAMGPNTPRPGINIRDSRVALYRCFLQGGMGYTGDAGGNCLLTDQIDGGPGGPGLLVEGTGNVFLSLSVLQGGQGGLPDTSCSGSVGPTGAGLETTVGAQFDIRALQSSPSSLQIRPGSTWNPLPGVARRLAGPALLADDETLALRYFGDPGDRVGLLFSTGHAHAIQTTGGPLLVQVPSGPDQVMWRFLGVIGAGGTRDVSLPMPNLPILTHRQLHLVGVSLAGTGRFYTNELSPALLDAAW